MESQNRKGISNFVEKLPTLQILTVKQQHDLVLDHIKKYSNQNITNILEAGCGQNWNFRLDDMSYRLTGVDLDGHALEIRKNEKKDLDEAILGDLRSVELPTGSFDIIYNSYVLEHIDGAKVVMDNFLKWLKPNGLLIIYIPDRKSAYGFLSSCTPHWIHVWFYRYILGRQSAGRPGNAPYRTYYDEIVSRSGIREYITRHGLILQEEYGYYKPAGLAGYLMDVVHALSFGLLASDHCDLAFIIKRQEK